MGIIKATVNIPSRSGLAEDKIVNTFVIGTPAEDSVLDASGPIAGALDALYNTDNAGGNSLAQYLHHSLSRVAEAVEVKLYDLEGHLDGTPTGSAPVVFTMTLDAAEGGLAFPAEVATVLTLRGQNWQEQQIERPDADVPPDLKPDRPRQRYSGRWYIGPLSSSILTTDLNDRTIVTPSYITAVLDAAERFQDTLDAADMAWMVWSRKDEVVRVIDSVSMDDAFDTMRKRGVAPTQRVSRSLAP